MHRHRDYLIWYSASVVYSFFPDLLSSVSIILFFFYNLVDPTLKMYVFFLCFSFIRNVHRRIGRMRTLNNKLVDGHLNSCWPRKLLSSEKNRIESISFFFRSWEFRRMLKDEKYWFFFVGRVLFVSLFLSIVIFVRTMIIVFWGGKRRERGFQEEDKIG